MQPATKQQCVALSATVLTLGLGAWYTSLSPELRPQIWSMAILLGLVWGTIAIWRTWQK